MNKLRSRIADWLDALSERLEGLAWRIRPLGKSTISPQLDELLKTTLRNRTPKIAAEIMRNNAFLRAMKDRPNG